MKINKIRIAIVFFTIAITISACTNKKNTGIDSTIPVETYTVNNSSNIQSSDIIDSISFLMLKEGKDSYFSTISKVKMINNRILIFDKMGKNALIEFDSNGEFVTSYSKRGKGVNEYIRLWDFDVDSNYVYLYDRSSRKMLYYDNCGKFVKIIRTEFRGDGFISIEGKQFLFSMAKEEGDKELCVVDSTLKISECLLSYEQHEMDDKITDNLFYEANNKITYNKPVSNHVFVLSKNGKINNCYYLDFNGQNVPDKLMHSYERLIEKDGKKKFIYMYDCPMIANNIIIANVFHQGNKATLLYDMKEKRSSIVDWKDGVKISDIILPVYACPKYIIGWMDYEVYNAIADKDIISDEMVRHMENGGRILIFYHLKK